MKFQSGRSLIEVIAVLAITGVMTASAFGLYQMIRNNQVKQVAAYKLERLAGDIKILMGMRGDYSGLSVDYLVNAGALESRSAPIGSDKWSVAPFSDNTSFSINLTDLSKGQCAYFAALSPKWAAGIFINGIESGKASDCFSTETNKVSFIVR